MPNKTLKESAKKTKSAHSVSRRQNVFFFLIFFSTTVLILAVLFILTPLGSMFSLGQNNDEPQYSEESVCLRKITSKELCSAVLEVADSPGERQRGLSEREYMPEHNGMLFIFDTPGKQCFWMKDTLIVLDMIWLDDSKTVTKIEPSVQPSSYPDTFCSDKSSDRYVIELNAGYTEKLGIKVGDILTF